MRNVYCITLECDTRKRDSPSRSHISCIMAFKSFLGLSLTFTGAHATACGLKVTHHTTGWLELRLTQPPFGVASPDATISQRPFALIKALDAASMRAISDPTVKGVLVFNEAGSAACCEDVRALSQLIAEPLGPATARQYLQMEYAITARLKTLTKPVVALADGILMGIGAGLFMSAGHRVSTASTVFSTPSTSIGLCPDNGALDFLTSPAISASLGLICALGGGRLSGKQMYCLARLSTRVCPGDETVMEDLRDSLLRVAPIESSRILRQGASSEAKALDVLIEAGVGESVEAAGSVVSSIAGSDQPGCTVGNEDNNDDALILAAVDRVVQNSEHLATQAAARLDALQDELSLEAGLATGVVAEWLAAHEHALSSGCPAAQIVTYSAYRQVLRERHWEQRRSRHTTGEGMGTRGTRGEARRRHGLDVELAANSVLVARADFAEAASCRMGLRSGDQPLWRHSTRQEAESDPEVQAIIGVVARQARVHRVALRLERAQRRH